MYCKELERQARTTYLTNMKKEIIYLDNAATTMLDPEVVKVMTTALQHEYGNPSSIHTIGRRSKAKIELVRKQIARRLNAKPGEIVFTSGGTESNNLALRSAVQKRGVKTIVTSPIEHPSVLKTISDLVASNDLELCFLKVDSQGVIDLVELEALLASKEGVLVSLMHGNNEIGNLLPLKKVGQLCLQHQAVFHTDTVQTMGHYSYDLTDLHLDYLVCSAHKIHGPKGVGFLYIRESSWVFPVLTGGKQERGWRAGTENIAGILGMGKALEIANENIDQHETYILSLKNYFIGELKNRLPQLEFNGTIEGNSMSTVLSVALPETIKAEMLLFQLDLKGIMVSGGSACSSGSLQGSAVIQAIKGDDSGLNLRFSFSRFNTKEELDEVVLVLAELLKI